VREGVLADDMGLGKDAATIALLVAKSSPDGSPNRASGHAYEPRRQLAARDREVRSLTRGVRASRAEAPSTLCIGIQRRRGAHDVPRAARDLASFEAREFYYLVLDEAQVIKNRRSLVTRAARSLQAEHRLCLTGTPIENSLEELWSIFEFLMPGLLGSAEQFRGTLSCARP